MTHTLFRSNREIVTLLAPYMPQRSGVSLDVEEYRDREPLMTDGVTTDFQDFQHVKAVYQILDMNNETGGIVTPDVGSSRPRTGHYTTTGVHRASDGTPLSPRSRHLRKKMDKLKRQLRNTASLEKEEKEEEGSSLEDGPLSVDLALVEKKRKRLLSYYGGQSSMAQETTEEEFSELHSRSGRYNSDMFRNGHRSDVSRTEEDSSRQLGGGSASKQWYNQSTVILSRSVILNLDNVDDDDEGREEYGESDLGHDISTGRLTDRSTDRSRTEPATPEGYVTSSPDSILSSLGLPEKTFDVNSFKSAEAGFDKNNPISLSSDLSAALSILSAAAEVVDPDITVADCLYSLPPPSLPKTPPSRTPYHGKVIALGESPTKSGDGATPH
ncbi:hypothetical protein KI688_001835 [Linnemannia hyalina]|uniref:Uncharacterized protein n=1 Tax=Linnemannia hyalina TaxID=64524 RepID=A0A9P8BU35_9FUNG|nr:hypothetical protein KI688_001835 [Linnemannia hyalina]